MSATRSVAGGELVSSVNRPLGLLRATAPIPDPIASARARGSATGSSARVHAAGNVRLCKPATSGPLKSTSGKSTNRVLCDLAEGPATPPRASARAFPRNPPHSHFMKGGSGLFIPMLPKLGYKAGCAVFCRIYQPARSAIAAIGQRTLPASKDLRTRKRGER
jgi:hypothetical protein